MNKNVCECCGSVIVPGKKVCPICGSKLDQTSEPNQEQLSETQILPNLDQLIAEMSMESDEDDLDFDMPDALKMKTQPKPMAAPPAEPVVPVDPDLPDFFDDEDGEDEDTEEEDTEKVWEEETPEEEDPEDEEEYQIPVPPVVPQPPQKPEKPQKKIEPKEQKAHKGENSTAVSGKDKAVCIILGFLVALFGVYIAYRFLQHHFFGAADRNKETISATLPAPTITADKVLTLPVQGEGRFLTVRLEPQNSGYEVTYESADPSIATVTSDGWVTAVSAGKTTVTITCQGVVAVSEIHCDFTPGATDPSATTNPTATETTDPGETTKPSETTKPGEPTEPNGADIKKLELSHSDVTMFEKGESVRLKVKGLSASQVTWSSDDSSIAEVEDGKVVAVGGGTTKIRAEYNGMEAVCIVRCQIEEDDNGSSSGELTLSHTDVTLTEGESFSLRLKDSDGNTVDVAWVQGNSSVCEISGNKITAVGTGYTEVTGTYDGKTYTCVVRVI